VHESIETMLSAYDCKTRDEYINALREILQSVALLGLWRCKFFEYAAFYGGSALRILHNLDRYSEDLDFSLLKPRPEFSLRIFGDALKREISSFGFQVEFETCKRSKAGTIESAFLKTVAYQQLLIIEIDKVKLGDLHPEKLLKIKLEVDVDPPGIFKTETQYVMHPIPFAVRIYSLPDLFAGKLHAVLFRRWKTRIKGRDWYDFVWYVTHHPQVNLRHLEKRMRQTEDYISQKPLTHKKLIGLLHNAIDQLDVDAARADVVNFLRNPRVLDIWSKDFFRKLVCRIISLY